MPRVYSKTHITYNKAGCFCVHYRQKSPLCRNFNSPFFKSPDFYTQLKINMAYKKYSITESKNMFVYMVFYGKTFRTIKIRAYNREEAEVTLNQKHPGGRVLQLKVIDFNASVSN
jgi:hypothetical protein